MALCLFLTSFTVWSARASEMASGLKMNASFEYGFASVVTHVIQFGQANPGFDLVRDGGQSTLFPSWRASVAFNFLNGHTLELLYQPVYLDTQSTLRTNAAFDNVAFVSGTPINTRYYFPFYRLTYFYHFIDNGTIDLAGSLGVQIRNATIAFEAADGSGRFTTTNIGPVPLLGLRLKWNFSEHLWLASELAGLWAPIPGINGSGEPVTGWIYDGALLFGMNLSSHLAWYFSSRIIGGGAKGDGSARPSGDRYSFNDLNLLNVTTGLNFNYPAF